MRRMHSPENLESESLVLLNQLQVELRDALDALAGKEGVGLIENYTFYTSVHVNRAAEGYVFLRKHDRIDASKHLVRTTIECVIRLQAILKKPESMFQIAFSEFEEDRKWVRSSAGLTDVSQTMNSIQNEWINFKQAYSAKYPNHPLVEESLSLMGAAQCAGLENYYNSHYRLYCRFTHGALRAATGALNTFDLEDNRTMALCVLTTIDALVGIGAPAPCVGMLRQRLYAFFQRIQDSNEKNPEAGNGSEQVV